MTFEKLTTKKAYILLIVAVLFLFILALLVMLFLSNQRYNSLTRATCNCDQDRNEEDKIKEVTEKDLPTRSSEIFNQIEQELAKDKDIEILRFTSPLSFRSSIDKYNLPDYVVADQIRYLYKLGNIEFALFQVPNMNNPYGSPGKYAGILYATEGSEDWKLFFLIKDIKASNNPYFLASNNNKLEVFVVDTSGAGSGEGTGKLLTSNNAGRSWSIDKCVYYIPENDPSHFDFDRVFPGSSYDLNVFPEYRYNEEKKYFEGENTIQAEKQTYREGNCENLIINNYKRL